MTALRDRYLAEIGIPVWRVRGEGAHRVASPAPPEAARQVATPSAPAQDGDAWSELQAKVRACTLCGLHRGRTQTVFGVGRRDASLWKPIQSSVSVPPCVSSQRRNAAAVRKNVGFVMAAPI